MVAKSKRKMNMCMPTPRLVGGAYVAKAGKSSKVLGGGGKSGKANNVSRSKKGNSGVTPTLTSKSTRQSRINTVRKIGIARTSEKKTTVGRASPRSLKQRSHNGGRPSPRRSVEAKLPLHRVEKRSTTSFASSTISSQVDYDALSFLASDKAPTLPSTGKGPNRHVRATIRAGSTSDQPIHLTRKGISSELNNPDTLEAKTSVTASANHVVVLATSTLQSQPSKGNDTNSNAAKPFERFNVESNSNFKSFDESVYTYATYTTAGSYLSLDNRVVFEMIVADATTGINKMVPQGFKDSVKDNVDRTKRVFDLSDISGTELATSAKEISIVTKDVVVQETTSCAAWSMPIVADMISSMVQGVASAASEALRGKNKESADDHTDLPIIDEMPKEEREVEIQADENKAYGYDQTNDQITDPDQTEKLQTEEPELSPSIEIIPVHVPVAEAGNQTKEQKDDDAEDKEETKAAADEEDGQGLGDSAEPSTSTGKNVAKSFTKAAKTTTKAVGRASNAFAKTSKQATGSALLSSSRAMGALRERLANANSGDREAVSWAGGEIVVEDADSRAESEAHSRHTA